MAKENRDNLWNWPIYVGKAVPKGSRKGGFGLGMSPGTVLYDRLREHARSIDQVENLQLADFCCRYLVVDDTICVVDPETYVVKADGQVLTCEPAPRLSLAQRYFLF